MKSQASTGSRAGRWSWLAVAALTVAGAGTPLAAQQRVLVPEGTVLTVRTDNAVSSQTARVGQAFATTVTEALDVDGYMVIPRGSRITGQITLARTATSRESGLIGVEFNRLVLPNGSSTSIFGKL